MLSVAEDADHDGVITHEEAQGAAYMKLVVAPSMRQLAIPASLANAVGTRYSDSMRRAIERLMHSQDTWNKHRKQQEAANAKRKSAIDKSAANSDTFDVWLAAKAGNVRQVSRYVEKTGMDVRVCGPADKVDGLSMLELACWNGHAALTNWLIDHVRERYGNEACKSFVNETDTAYIKCTPLITASRTRIGFLNDRLSIVKALVNAGADATAQDCYGDNCLHWAARVSSLPIVRYLVHCTEGAVFASVTANNKGRKPIDVAAMVDLAKWKVNDWCERSEKDATFCTSCNCLHVSSYTTVEIYRMLQNHAKGCNMRLKIQKGIKRRHTEFKRQAQFATALREKVSRDAQAVLNKAKQEWKRQYEAAEAQRLREEEDAMEAAGAKAVAEAEVWVDATPEGKRLLKDTIDAVMIELKAELRKQGRKATRDTKKIAAAKAKARLFKAKHDAAGMVAQKAFRAHNPPVVMPHLG